MVRIPFVPESAVDEVQGLLSGGVLDTLWKVAVIAVALVVFYVLLVGGGVFGGVVAGAAISTLISDEVRAFFRDFWNRNWAELRIPYT
ncbi:hypothetical protein [Haloarcula sp. Atlit-120R]|uniref:hypothetical protein n=1 Tax=Haloarcula sp. Atlit-120R TaxID=2282135 RepID=UPI000EF1D183|nr:hypothetical protein [Haloarcula sp. Atlit-120R]RLM32620.1 hypothetical protein DVK01_20315 [Haloarcula sp. Atlit-120R]